MSNLLIGVLGALVATNQPEAFSNLVTQTTGVSIAAVSTNSPVEQELQKIEEGDDVAAAEVDGWIKQNQQFEASGAGIPKGELNRRIRERFDASKKAYQDFIKKYPDYAEGRIAYASFLNDLGDEEGSFEQLLKARDINPKLPAIWNNLANYYGEHGPLTNAFICYEKAIQIDPTEPVYYENFGTTVYLYRKDVREYYHINEQQVFDKAMGLYSNSMRLDPTNFQLASDVATSYYGIKPLRTNDALVAWTNTLALAHNEADRESVYIHFARVEAQSGNFADAHKRLDAVTNETFADLKRRVTRSLHDKEHPEEVTNDVPDLPVVMEKTNVIDGMRELAPSPLPAAKP